MIASARWIVAPLLVVAACDSPTKPDPPVATSLAFDVQPSNAVAGGAISPAVRVRVLDASGNVFAGPIAVGITLGSANGATLLGTTSATAANGVATFPDLRLEKAGVGYALTATSGSLAPATSNAFDVAHAAAAKLRFVGQPPEGVAGKPLSPAVAVEIVDQYDNRVTSATHAVTISREGSGPVPVIVLGTATVDAVAGVATFGNISLNRLGPYALRAAATGLTPAVSAEILVKAASVSRFCPGDAASGASFGFFQDAIGATEPGGTVAICDGTHDINGVTIDRPITIVPEHDGMVTVTNTKNTFVFLVSAVPQGTVRIARLTFEVTGPGAVSASDRYDEVIVEGSTFRAVPGATSVITASQNLGPATGAIVIARGNTAIGFKDAFWAQFNLRMNVIDNRIESSTSNAINYGKSTSGVIQGNRIRQCGRNACIWAVPLEGGPVEVVDNDIENDISRNTISGIRTQGRVNVRRNRVIGTGGTGVQRFIGAASFAFQPAAIAIAGHEGVTPIVEGNEVKNAFYGIELIIRSPGGSVMRDNRISDVGWVYAPAVSTPGDFFERNDASNYAGAVAAQPDVAARFKCNWWGGQTGPAGGNLIPTSLPASLWQPFSRVPIAGKPEVACDPNGPWTPARFCPAAAPTRDGWASFGDALTAAGTGGTVLVCDGRYALRADLRTPVTVAAEHRHGATLTGERVFTVFQSGPGTTAFRDLRFETQAAAIDVSSAGDVAIEGNQFTAVGDVATTLIFVGGLYTGDVLIRGNDFIGSQRGVWVERGGRVSIVENSFSAQREIHGGATIDLSYGPGPYVVRGNRLSDCPMWCIKGSNAPVDIVENVIAGRVADPTLSAIKLVGGQAVVSRNRIESADPAPADRSTANAYAFPEAAVLIDLSSKATIDENTIRHAYVGIRVDGPESAAGQNNVVTLTRTAIHIGRTGAPFHRNDFSDFVIPVTSVNQPDGELSCNYWGSSSAPAVLAHLEAVVRPHSPVPIAGKPSVICP